MCGLCVCLLSDSETRPHCWVHSCLSVSHPCDSSRSQQTRLLVCGPAIGGGNRAVGKGPAFPIAPPPICSTPTLRTLPCL